MIQCYILGWFEISEFIDIIITYESVIRIKMLLLLILI